MEKVSIIIPTHSRPDLLERAVKSALNAATDAEVIVVDDASKDSTAAVCRTLDSIKYIRVDRNQGVAGARNIGILASTADYIAFLDDDDIRLPGTIDAQRELLVRAPELGFVYAPVYLADQNGRSNGDIEPKDCPQGDIFWDLISRSFIYPSAVVIRKSCLLRVGLLNPNLAGLDEWDLWVRIAEIYPVAALQEPVAVYRTPGVFSDQLTTSMSTDLHWGYWKHQLQLLRLPRALAAGDSKRIEARQRLRNLASDKLIIGASIALEAGENNQARRWLMNALRLHPSRAARPWTLWLMLLSCLKKGNYPEVIGDARLSG